MEDYLFSEQFCESTGFDGGFYFSPIVLRANKGRLDTNGEIPFWQSYATATCEGLLALTAAGVAREDNLIGLAN